LFASLPIEKKKLEPIEVMKFTSENYSASRVSIVEIERREGRNGSLLD
jgi:hypothetical protein